MATTTRSHHSYSVGVTCDLAVEKAVVEAILNEKHPCLGKIVGDDNDYTFGRIGDDDVAIACLLTGVMGKASAASKLSGLVSCTFTSNAATATAVNEVYKVLIVPDAAALLAGAVI